MAGRLWYDAFASLYALCVVFWFLDAVQPRRWVNRAALALLFMVFVLETGFLFARLHDPGGVFNRFDATLLVSWLIIVVALVVDTVFRVDLLLFLANLVSFMLVAFDTFVHQERLVYGDRPADLLVLHVSFALTSYVAFSFAFVFSVMYLTQDWILRSKKWSSWYFRLLPLQTLEANIFRSVAAGLPLLLVAMILGVIWSIVALGRVYWLDPKLVATCILWASYGVWFWLRNRFRWADRQLVWLCVLCYGGVIVNLIVVSGFSFFHHSG